MKGTAMSRLKAITKRIKKRAAKIPEIKAVTRRIPGSQSIAPPFMERAMAIKSMPKRTRLYCKL